MFGIFLEKTPVSIENELVQPAKIIIDEFEESLRLPLSYWSANDYKNFWIKSLEEGISSKKHAALAVSMYEPEQSNFIFTWVIYFENDKIFLQNNILFLNEIQGFMPDRINDFIDIRTTHNEDGRKISEWSTDFKSVIDFYNSLK
ncbi:hypothetical protein [Yersinia alsatica]|uniref:hypothetical protein n=1 Tax=Yersinia alsatica TaxID=2890317 RepID=UPI0011A7A0C6|nr:hypothetical protein [Yersinia alsatica]